MLRSPTSPRCRRSRRSVECECGWMASGGSSSREAGRRLVSGPSDAHISRRDAGRGRRNGIGSTSRIERSGIGRRRRTVTRTNEYGPPPPGVESPAFVRRRVRAGRRLTLDAPTPLRSGSERPTMSMFSDPYRSMSTRETSKRQSPSSSTSASAVSSSSASAVSSSVSSSSSPSRLYLRRNRSTRPSVSTSFFCPV